MTSTTSSSTRSRCPSSSRTLVDLGGMGGAGPGRLPRLDEYLAHGSADPGADRAASSASRDDRVLFVEHHLSHAASAFFCSPFESAARPDHRRRRRVGDGDPRRRARRRLAHARHRSTRSTSRTRSACSTRRFTALLGFEVNDGEYKVMGMAPYGEPKYVDELQQVVHTLRRRQLLARHGLLQLPSFEQADLHAEVARAVRDRAAQAGRARSSRAGSAGASLEERARSQCYADVAASVQRTTEEAIINMARTAAARDRLERLCMAGGVAFNSVANGRILRRRPFEELFIQPAAGDSGGALAAPPSTPTTSCSASRARSVLEHAYWGPEYERRRGQVGPARRRRASSTSATRTRWQLLDATVEALASGRGARLVPGPLRVGPARARQPQHPRRPAPRGDEGRRQRPRSSSASRSAVRAGRPRGLRRHARAGARARRTASPARFMLVVIPARRRARRELPAVSHLGTARFQTVHAGLQPALPQP